jgi:hypothetical protein
MAHRCPGRVQLHVRSLAKADTAFQAHPLVNQLNLALDSLQLMFGSWRSVICLVNVWSERVRHSSGQGQHLEIISVTARA